MMSCSLLVSAAALSPLHFPIFLLCLFPIDIVFHCHLLLFLFSLLRLHNSTGCFLLLLLFPVLICSHILRFLFLLYLHSCFPLSHYISLSLAHILCLLFHSCLARLDNFLYLSLCSYSLSLFLSVFRLFLSFYSYTLYIPDSVLSPLSLSTLCRLD